VFVETPLDWEKVATAFESCTTVCLEKGALVDTLVTYIETGI
jgi:hypothetical protein